MRHLKLIIIIMLTLALTQKDCMAMGEQVDESKWFNVVLEVDYKGEPITATGAIACKPTRYLHTKDNRPGWRQNGYYISSILPDEKVLVMRVPTFCKVDFHDKKKLVVKKISKEFIPLISVIDDKNEIKQAEQIIAPDYYKQPHAEVKYKSMKITPAEKASYENNSRENHNRYSWMRSGSSGGWYEAVVPQDRGYYFSFGVFIWPKDIWSKLPPVVELIKKIEKKHPNTQYIYIRRDDEKEAQKAIAYLHYLGNPSYLDDGQQYAEYGITKFTAGTRFLIYRDDKRFPKIEGERVLLTKLWRELEYFNSKNYFYGLKFNENHWEFSRSAYGKVIYEKIEKDRIYRKNDKGKFKWSGTIEFDGNIYDNPYNEPLLIYDSTTKEIIDTIRFGRWKLQ